MWSVDDIKKRASENCWVVGTIQLTQTSMESGCGIPLYFSGIWGEEALDENWDNV